MSHCVYVCLCACSAHVQLVYEYLYLRMLLIFYLRQGDHVFIDKGGFKPSSTVFRETVRNFREFLCSYFYGEK